MWLVSILSPYFLSMFFKLVRFLNLGYVFVKGFVSGDLGSRNNGRFVLGLHYTKLFEISKSTN